MDDLFNQICSYPNLFRAYLGARKGKTNRLDVLEFEKALDKNLKQLQADLISLNYYPQPLVSFVIKEPKTRVISKSAFRDRIVHHAIHNIIEPLFEKQFIYDSYANRKGKGALRAIERFSVFSRKCSKSFKIPAFVLKADIKHYFESVDHETLSLFLQKRIAGQNALLIIRRILANYNCKQGKGMPLGNLTSQFFANIYLNELDQYIKHILKVKYYIRYVDDFVILGRSINELEIWRNRINDFLNQSLKLQLHPDKTRIIQLEAGTPFLGFKIFPQHRVLKKQNRLRFLGKLHRLYEEYHICRDNYDQIYDLVEGWCAYAKQASTYKLRKGVLNSYRGIYTSQIGAKDVNRYLKHAKSSKLVQGRALIYR